MKTAIITDQHGCEKEFKEIIGKLELSSDDYLLCAGDIIDKGPASAACVKYLRELSGHCHVELAFSNHEAKFQRFCKKYRKDPASVRKMRNHYELEELYHGLDKEDFDFLETAKIWLQVPGENAIVVHAGIQPAVKALPPTKTISEFAKDEIEKYSHFWYCRYVRGGYMLHLGKEEPGDPFWASVYDGRFGHVYFGHQPFMQSEAVKFDHATGLDLGCVQGGKLCAAIIGDKDVKFLTVDGYEYVKPKEIYPE